MRSDNIKIHHVLIFCYLPADPFKQNKIQQGSIPERNSLAKPTWSLSLAIATTRANGASGNIIRIVFTKALADSLV